MEQYLALVEPYIREYGYISVFTMVFLESFGLPLPGESAVIASAVFASRGDLHVVPLLGAVWVAAVLGDNTGYAIGLFGGRRLVIRYGTRVGLTEPRLAKVEGFFQRYGPEVVLVARFFVPLRQLNGLIAGTVAMPWHRFLLYNVLGAALWVAVWGLGVYFIGSDIVAELSSVLHFGYVSIAIAGVVALALLVVWRFRTRHRS